MEKLGGISELKNLHRLGVYECSRLLAVEGLGNLEFLIELDVYKCPSLKILVYDIRNSKIQDKCQITSLPVQPAA
ncbi:hypothetical protein NL676_034323 [Syzygium grande]|nr:hypothetical protein NL676_034323 [Syzygium grande]